MAKGTKLQLETGQVLAGTLEYVDVAKSAKPGGDKQLRLTAVFDGVGLGYLYLHRAVLAQLVGLKLVTVTDQFDTYGEVKITHTKPWLAITKREYEPDKVETVVLARGMETWPTHEQVRAHPLVNLPSRQLPTPAGVPPVNGGAAPPPPSGAVPSPTPPSGAAAAPAPSSGPTSEPARPQKTVEQIRSETIAWWMREGDAYTCAAMLAAHGLAKALGCEVRDLDQQAVQAGTATLLIRAEKAGVVTYRGMAKAVRSVLEAVKRVSDSPTPPEAMGAKKGTPALVGAGGGDGHGGSDDLDPPIPEDDDLPF